MAKVLIVDDEPIFRETLSKYVLRLGHEVESAGDVASALECGRRMAPDILFVDWMLKSELNGLDVTRTIGESVPALIAVIITGDLSLELPADLAETGRNSILRKPFGLESIKAALDDMISHQRD